MARTTGGTTTRSKVAVAKATAGSDLAVSGATIFDLIERMKPQLARALPAGMSAERFIRIALTEIRRNPRLASADSRSFLGALMLSAQLGLEPGPLGHAYFTGPFKNRKTGVPEIVFIIGYRGLIDLARRSGNITSIVAREVCANDVFEFEYGLDERLVHRPALTDRGDVVAYYGVAHYTDGGHTILVMSPDDVNKYRARSRASSEGPWVTDYDAMAKKTVIRRMSAFLPLTIEAAKGVASDEAVITLDDDDLGVLDAVPEDISDEVPEETPSGGDGAEPTLPDGEPTPATTDNSGEPTLQSALEVPE